MAGRRVLVSAAVRASWVLRLVVVGGDGFDEGPEVLRVWEVVVRAS